MSATPPKSTQDRAAQALGVLLVICLAAITVVEAIEQSRWLAQVGVVMKYLGFVLVIAWPLLRGNARRQAFDARVALGLSLVLIGMSLHWGARWGYF